jgi:hypothetical protein
MSMYRTGDRVRVHQPSGEDGKPHLQHGRVGMVIRHPTRTGVYGTPDASSCAYAVRFDGMAYPHSPFRDAGMTSHFALIVAETQRERAAPEGLTQ